MSTDERKTSAKLGALAFLGLLLVFAAAVAFQVADTIWSPLHAWDESRLAVSALEMYMSGNYLVTTYNFAPDLWSTKPPLMIDLMVVSMKAFGVTPFAVRLPSVVATLLTVYLVGRLVHAETRSLAAGVFAGLVLLAHPVFNGMHGGATGDYDSLLTLFTTAYGIVLFNSIHAEGRNAGQAVLAGILVGLATWTKGVAGLLMGGGIAVYAIFFAYSRFWQKLPDYLITVFVGLGLGLAYYLVRSTFGSNYIDAVLYGETGRFFSVVDYLDNSPDFFVRVLIGNPLEFRKPAYAFVLALGIFLLPRGRLRSLGLFALCQSIALLAILSLSATKLAWYIIPAIPWLAVATAIGGYAIYAALRDRNGAIGNAALANAAPVLAAVLAFIVVAGAVRDRYLAPEPADLRDFGGLIVAAENVSPDTTLTVVDGGFPHKGRPSPYAPTLRFHRLAASLTGVKVNHATSMADAAAAPLLGSCDPLLRDRVAASGRVLWRQSGCVLVDRRNRSAA